MDIIIFSGQSNMQGQTEGLPKDNQPVDNAWEYLYESDSFRPLRHPIGENLKQGEEDLFLPASDGGGSLIPSFCRTFVKETNREVLAVHVAKGATTISEWQPDTNRYKALVKKVLSAKQKAKERGEIGNIYFIWLQGESDAVHNTTETEYYNRFITIKQALKKDVGVQFFGIIKVGYFSSVATWNKNGDMQTRIAQDQAIMSAQEKIALDEKDCKIVTRICEKLSREKEYINPFESGHYNNKAMEEIGINGAKGLIENFYKLIN